MYTRRSFNSLLGAAPFAASGKGAAKYLVYFGTYTQKTAKGIYVSQLDTVTGKVSQPELAAETPNPSFVALHPNGRNLYAVTESGPGLGLSAFSVDRASGKLTKINSVSSQGAGPCHLNVDQTGHALVVANYDSGSVAALPVNSDGSLSESVSHIQHHGTSVDKSRQEGPHAHSVNISRDNRFVICADLGLDEVLVYKFDAAKATLAPNDPAFVKVSPGSGPRHFAFHPGGKFAYVINEMKSTVTAFHWDAKLGAFHELQTISTLPDDFKGENSTAEVVIHPSGKFLYGSNRGHNTLAVFSIAANGMLKRLENVSTQGKIPRNFAIEPTGRWLLAANQDSDTVAVFAVEGGGGKLKPTGQMVTVGMPVCVRFLSI